MEVVAGAVLGALTSTVTSKLFTVAEKMYKGKDKESKDLDAGIKDLKEEFHIISAAMKDQLSHTQQPSVVTVSMDEFSKVALEIEDCLDQFLPCAACGEETVRSTKKKFLAEITVLRERLNGAYRRKEVFHANNKASASARSNVDHTTQQDMGTYEACPPVGMEEPTQELGELLVGGEASNLKVISIVGFGGSGKTALAWALFNCDEIKRQFPRRAWVVASKHENNAQGLLTAILKDLLGAEAQDNAWARLMAILKGLLGAKAQAVTQDLGQLQQHIRHQLETKRCLIVIDDINLELWDEIKHMFSEMVTESRILVTTPITTVANVCSLHGGYIYNMRSLSAKQSKDYLGKQEIFKDRWSPDMEMGSTAIVKRCDGHPLSLVSVAKALQDHGSDLTADLCEEICVNLCSCIDENKNGHFTKLRQVLMNNYSSLPDNSLKTCLLYTSLFPNGRPISRKTLTRRWLAEGYIDGDLKVADKKFEELIDRNVIRPIDTSNNGNAKTCKTHSIMHQFMLHKSISSNFIARSFGARNRSNSRHLIIENNTNGKASDMDHGTGPAARHRNPLKNIFTRFKPSTSSESEELRPRSLTVFGSAEEFIYSGLTNCQLLRVLDLKECNDDLSEEHLQNIYKMLHLKYLTFGSSVNISKLSDRMKRLHCLETLDLGKTKIQTLPLEIISLPHLAHLFGKIKLEHKSCHLDEFFLVPSNLQTLAGVVVDNKSRFPDLMAHMKQLRKVKIWCDVIGTHGENILCSLSECIQKFANTEIDTPVNARCLSLHFNQSSKKLLADLDDRCAKSGLDAYLSSLKLHGIMIQFPQFVTSMCGLKELCLISTNLSGDVLLANLRRLQHLLYLKLVEINLAGFDVQDGDFLSLKRLCFVVENPRFPTIQQGALPRLTSIQLLCKDLQDLCEIKIECFKDIQEIALDSMVNKETLKLWENEAKKHPKRPRVMLLKRVVDPAETRPSVKYVASCQLDNSCYCDTCAVDHMEIDFDRLTLHNGA